MVGSRRTREILRYLNGSRSRPGREPRKARADDSGRVFDAKGSVRALLGSE